MNDGPGLFAEADVQILQDLPLERIVDSQNTPWRKYQFAVW